MAGAGWVHPAGGSRPVFRAPGPGSGTVRGRFGSICRFAGSRPLPCTGRPLPLFCEGSVPLSCSCNRGCPNAGTGPAGNAHAPCREKSCRGRDARGGNRKLLRGYTVRITCGWFRGELPEELRARTGVRRLPDPGKEGGNIENRRDGQPAVPGDAFVVEVAEPGIR